MSEVTVFLDVDGVLSPVAPPRHDHWDDWERIEGIPFHLVLSRQMAARIADLGAEIIWLTTWEHDANAVVADYLGWEPHEVLERKDSTGQWWKFEALAERIESDPRPFAWIDDELERRKRDVGPWLRDRDVPVLALSPRSEIGLTPGEITRLEDFVAEHAGGAVHGAG